MSTRYLDEGLAAQKICDIQDRVATEASLHKTRTVMKGPCDVSDPVG
jgi:hypothetical protein